MRTLFVPATFTPSEVERITGTSTTLQRDWRRRGYLPSHDGHARFNVLALAELWSLKLLADRGIGPQHASEVADFLGLGIAGYALALPIAWEGDHPGLGEVTDVKTPNDLRRYLENEIPRINPGTKVDLSSAPLRALVNMPPLARMFLREHSPIRGAGKVIPARYFLWFPDGSHRWDASVDDVMDTRKTSGAVVVLDQFTLAQTLVERAGRPLVHVEAASLNDSTNSEASS